MLFGRWIKLAPAPRRGLHFEIGGYVEARVLQEYRTIVGASGLITKEEELRVYECDGLTNFRVMPQAVVLPTTAKQVQEIVRVCHREKIPYVARGSGTGLSGGARPVHNGIVISLARLERRAVHGSPHPQ